MVCAMSVAHCQQGNTNATPPQGDGTANGDSSGNSNNNTFDKNRIAINGIGAFFTQLNNDLLYLRNFIMSNVAEVGLLFPVVMRMFSINSSLISYHLKNISLLHSEIIFENIFFLIIIRLIC